MVHLGKITVRGPYHEFEKKRIASLIESHPFNTEISCYVPFVETNNRTTHERSENQVEEDKSDEDEFLSLSLQKSIVYNDAELLKPTDFYYQIKGPIISFFQEPFYSSYVNSPNGLTLTTINTPTALSNSICIIQGKLLCLRMDKKTYNRLGLVGKHASAHLLSDTIYICTIKLTNLKSTSKQIRRIVECLSSIPPIEAVCFYGNQEISFPPDIQVQKITNEIEQARVTNLPIPHLQSSVFEDVLKPLALDPKNMPESLFKERKEEIVYNREEVLRGFLDWVGIVDAKSQHMQFEMHSEINQFNVTTAFRMAQASNQNCIKVYRSSGYMTSTVIKDDFEFLSRHVNEGKSPFAVLSVFGDVNCSGQWVLHSKISEFDYQLNDDASYLILILPESTFYVIMCTSDLETRF